MRVKQVATASVYYPDMLVVVCQYVSCELCGASHAMYQQTGTDRALCSSCAANVQAAISRLKGSNHDRSKRRS